MSKSIDRQIAAWRAQLVESTNELRRNHQALNDWLEFSDGLQRVITRKPIAIGTTEQRNYQAEIADSLAAIAEIERLQRLAIKTTTPKKQRK